MEWYFALIIVLGVLFGLLMIGIWLPFAILVAGMLTIFMQDGVSGFRAIGFVLWSSSNSFTLTAVPLFILMSEILLRSGLTGPLYTALARVTRPIPGGLLQTNIVASGVFSAICGSSVATAASIGAVALPNLKERGYNGPLSYGSLAAGGTLGILLPPSIPFILYGSFTEVSVAKLFMAGVVPGIVLIIIFMIYLGIRGSYNPPKAETTPAELPLRRALLDLIPFSILIVAVMGSIYLGIATPTEAAALGCTIALVISIAMGKFSLRMIGQSLSAAAFMSCSILMIVIAATVFAYSFENADLGTELTKWVLSLNLSYYAFLLVLLLLYLALGTLLESIAMIVITVPLIFPTVVAYGIDPLWFAVALVVLVEIGQLTPPFGINLFVIKKVANAPLGQVLKGTVPYYGLMLGFLLLLTIFPQIATYLPSVAF